MIRNDDDDDAEANCHFTMYLLPETFFRRKDVKRLTDCSMIRSLMVLILKDRGCATATKLRFHFDAKSIFALRCISPGEVQSC